MVSTQSAIQSGNGTKGLEKDSYVRAFRSSLIAIPFFIYRIVVSPFFHAISGAGFGCRYPETCSAFGERVIKEKGIIIGLPLLVKRVISCNPWSSQIQETFNS